jgi:hypothetical protein
MQRYTVCFIWKLLYIFLVTPSPIIRSASNCIYIVWYLSYLYCYLPLSWKGWNWFEWAVGGVWSFTASLKLFWFCCVLLYIWLYVLCTVHPCTGTEALYRTYGP